MQLAERQSDLLRALYYTKGDLSVGCPVVKDFHVRRKHVLFKNAFKVTNSRILSHVNRVIREKYCMSKKFKVNFVINLIKRKLISMSVLFWPETRNADLVDHKNSYIGAACQVRLAGGNVALCCRQVGSSRPYPGSCSY